MTDHEARESSPENLPSDLAAVWRLAAVTGAAVLVLLVLAATDALILHALPLAGIALGCALAFYAGFVARPPAFRRFGKAAFIVMACSFFVTGYAGWQGRRTAKGLTRVITPVPQIVSVARREPSADLIAALALSATLEAMEGARSRLLAGEPPDTAARGGWARLVDRENQRYWVVETKLDIAQVMEFYSRPENRLGWTVAAERAEGLLALRRGGEELLIMASDGAPRARSRVAYLYIGDTVDD